MSKYRTVLDSPRVFAAIHERSLVLSVAYYAMLCAALESPHAVDCWRVREPAGGSGRPRVVGRSPLPALRAAAA